MNSSFMNHRFMTASTSLNEDAEVVNENEKERKLVWVPDEEVTQCFSCNVVFNVRIRKHHCRACGNVFCSNCSDNRIKISEYSFLEKVRVCDKCFVERSSPHTLLLQEDLGARKQINQDLKKALSEKMAIVERFKTFLLEFESEILNNGFGSNELENSNRKDIQINKQQIRNSTDPNIVVNSSSDKENENHTTKENTEEYDNDDVMVLLKKSEAGLKVLNDKIKNYNYVIERQRNELSKLKNEKIQKDELTKMLSVKNDEIKKKNHDISSLLDEKKKLMSMKDEYESIIELHKKQIERLIIRCNTLEIERNCNNKTKERIKYYPSTKSNSSKSATQLFNSMQSSQMDMSISYTVADGIDEQEENENCCNRCQRRMCRIM